MATYKVLQDIEAEDKLVGPLSLRQFIYAGVAVVSLFIAFKLAFVNLVLIAPFVPVIVLFGTLAIPFGHEQPSEVWLLAKIKFFVKPHLRVWSNAGGDSLVTITAPKLEQAPLTKNFTRTEARSRLQALANTIDSRGWSVKNVNVNLSDQAPEPISNDRLVNPKALTQTVPQDSVTAADDILDASSNPTAQKLDKMIADSTAQHKQRAIESIEKPAEVSKKAARQRSSSSTPDYWFMNEAPTTTPAGYTRFKEDKVYSPADTSDSSTDQPETADDEDLLKKIESNKRKSDIVNSHMHTLQPLGKQSPKKIIKTPTAKVTPPASPDIINLALANKDNWSVATIARQAEKAKRQEPPRDEVIISLH